ncbi:hypothetical protein AB1N83_003544 [Pleurotus pulmonarius]
MFGSYSSFSTRPERRAKGEMLMRPPFYSRTADFGCLTSIQIFRRPSDRRVFSRSVLYLDESGMASCTSCVLDRSALFSNVRVPLRT